MKKSIKLIAFSILFLCINIVFIVLGLQVVKQPDSEINNGNPLSNVTGSVTSTINVNENATSTKPSSNITSDTPSIPKATTEIYIFAASDATVYEKTQANFICNGISDATDIPSMINAGKHYYFTSGTFNLNQRFYLKNKDNVTLEGMGSSTIFKVNNKVSSNLSIDTKSVQNQIEVSSVRGFVVGQDVFIGSGIDASHVEVFPRLAPYWENQRNVGPAGESNIITGIDTETKTLTLFYNLTNSYLSGIPIWTIYDAMYFDTCNNIKILNIALNGNIAGQTPCNGDIFQNGIRLSRCRDAEIAGTYIYDIVYNHIILHPGNSLRAMIHDNNIYNSAPPTGTGQNRGIVIEGNSNNTIVRNNKIVGVATGLYDVGSSVSFRNNIISNTSYASIYINNGSDSEVTKNIITKSSGSYVIAVDKYTNNLSIVENEIIDSTTKNFIWVEPTCSNIIIFQNSVKLERIND